ncbi:MAG TPA: hypothetical protein VE569_02135 [Acidimicrobiia bacterium]|nr:hypothetical protein [Acidimicrobiia bacterium]
MLGQVSDGLRELLIDQFRFEVQPMAPGIRVDERKRYDTSMTGIWRSDPGTRS